MTWYRFKNDILPPIVITAWAVAAVVIGNLIWAWLSRAIWLIAVGLGWSS